MNLSQFCGSALLCAIGCLAAFGASGDISKASPEVVKPSAERMDRSWKRYKNANLGYCVSYPARWSRGSAFDGSGLFVEAGAKGQARPSGEIDFGPMNVESLEDARLKPASDASDSLDQNLQEHIAALQKFTRAEKLEILEERKLSVQGFNALFVKNKYYDPVERTNWMQEVVFVKHNGELFRIELQCKPDKIARFEPVFSYLLNTLAFDCK